MPTLHRRLRAVTFREVDDELLLLDTEWNRIHQLNKTASFIWRKCDEVASATELAELLAKEFDVEQDVALRDVGDMLDRLRALDLIVETIET
jgi:hypothetical protein